MDGEGVKSPKESVPPLRIPPNRESTRSETSFRGEGPITLGKKNQFVVLGDGALDAHVPLAVCCRSLSGVPYLL